MSKALVSRTARVLIIDPSSAVRQLLSDVVKSLGFRELSTATNCKDALQMLEFEDFQWIISPLLADDPVNALHLLKIFSEDVKTRTIRVSLIVDASEYYALPVAFDLGLMSFHPKAFTRDAMEPEFKEVMSYFDGNGGNSTLAASEYVHKFLLLQQKYRNYKTFVDRLLKLFPGSSNAMMKLAEAQFVVHEPGRGLATLLQIENIYDNLKPKLDALSKKYLGSASESDASGVRGQNALGVKHVMIIDPDTDVQRKLKEFLSYAGVPEIVPFENGEDAWKYYDTHEAVDLIIQEWRIPRLSGPQFLQRVRQKGLNDVPIIAISSLIRKDETALVREMGVSAVVAKPFDKFTFFKDLVWTLQQHMYPTDQKSIEQKIRLLLRSEKIDEAQQMLAQYLENKQIPDGSKRQLEAEIAFVLKKYKTARNRAIEALKIAGDSLFMLNLLGKCFMKTGEFAAALKCMEKAQSISPHNIERLCNIAEVQFDLGMQDEAKDTVASARALDAGNDMVKEIDAEIALLTGDKNRAKSIMSQMDSLPNIVSFMNNRAVALIRCGQFDEGIQLYKDTMNALPGDWSETHDIVAYNLGLAYARHGDVALAIEQLELVKATENLLLSKKAESLKTRLNQVKLSGQTLVLKGADPIRANEDDDGGERRVENKVEDDGEEVLIPQTSSHGAIPGELCCHLIFQAQPEEFEAAKRLLENVPKFVTRKALQKET